VVGRLAQPPSLAGGFAGFAAGQLGAKLLMTTIAPIGKKQPLAAQTGAKK